jgi:mono/diheme cytochrome c family protein
MPALRSRPVLVIAALLLLLAPLGLRAAPPASYEQDVLPLFLARCGACHGAARTEAGLDLRTHGDLVQGGYSGSPVVPGAPEKSLLYQMLADGRMPKGPRLNAAELGRVARWIRAGAPGTTGRGGHWAFRPPTAPMPPAVRAAARVRNPVDRFVLAELERRGLSLSPEADRRVLIRRVTFDLIGLPPTPEEVDAFLADTRPEAYERLVDRLLADPRHGERWARHWLDTAGYADSEGVLQEDRIRPNAWRYRDYVIRAFNDDKPYDEFLRQQLAGDEYADYRTARRFTPEIIEAITATGFLRTAVDGTRDDFNPHQYGEYQYRMLHDTQTIVGATVLGLTVSCARCHNHKYEPLTQVDYYRMQALFTGAVRPRGKLLPTNRRQIVAAGVDELAEAGRVNAEVDRLVAAALGRGAAVLREKQERALAENRGLAEADRQALRVAIAANPQSDAHKQLLAKHQLSAEALQKTDAGLKATLDEVAAEVRAAQARRITFPEIRAFYDQDAAPPPTPLLHRGEWLKPGDPVEPGIPALLADAAGPFQVPAPAPGAATTGRRRAFAEWVTRSDHPLTGRVLVNRIWAHHFGAGIVTSLDNLGRSGSPPSHPALLDWLAAHFTGRAVGGPLQPWRLKSLHRLLVTSAAYRQASRNRAEAARLDPSNRWLWRYPPRRLEAEAVRDAVLTVSGTLDPTMFGEPVGNETRGTGEIVATGEEGRGRRSLYLLVRRSMPVSLLNAFDQPVMETNCTRRVVSTTPTQALALMNSTFLAAQASHFGRRLLTGRADSVPGEALIVDGYRLAFGRPATPAEVGTALRFLAEQEARYLEEGRAAQAARESAVADFAQALLASNEFVYLD